MASGLERPNNEDPPSWINAGIVELSPLSGRIVVRIFCCANLTFLLSIMHFYSHQPKKLQRFSVSEESENKNTSNWKHPCDFRLVSEFRIFAPRTPQQRMSTRSIRLTNFRCVASPLSLPLMLIRSMAKWNRKTACYRYQQSAPFSASTVCVRWLALCVRRDIGNPKHVKRCRNINLTKYDKNRLNACIAGASHLLCRLFVFVHSSIYTFFFFSQTSCTVSAEKRNGAKYKKKNWNPIFCSSVSITNRQRETIHPTNNIEGICYLPFLIE